MRLAVALILAVALCGSADAQQVKKSTLSGTIMSAAVTIPVSTAPLLTAPPSTGGRFILTQACISDVPTAVVLRSVALGRLALQAGCTTFDPGFAIAAGDTLECENLVGGAQTCVVSGVLSKK